MTTSQQYHAPLPTGRVDEGLFGPGSMTWRVWSDPAVIVGVTRSFVLDMVGSPMGAAAMEDHSLYRQDPLGRFRRTFHYFYSVVFGDTVEVERANLRLRRLHQRIVGTEPMTGQPYAALDPYLQLGTVLNTWHSVYVAYEQLGGRTTAADEAAYFADGVRFAEALGIDVDAARAAAVRHGIAERDAPTSFPATREEYRAMWAAARHLICVNHQTRSALDAILTPRGASGDPAARMLLRLYPAMARVGVALLPRDMRRTVGMASSPLGDRVALACGRGVAGLLRRTGTGSLLMRSLSPQAHALREDAVRQLAPA